MRTTRWVSWTGFLVLSLFLAGSLSGRADLLDDVKARRTVEAQRIERLVLNADANATQLMRKGRSGEAVEALRSALAFLETDTSLSLERREALKRQINRSLKQLQFEARNPVTAPETLPARVIGSERTRAEDQRRRDAEIINRTQQDIRSAEQSGNYRAAQQMREELEQAPPQQPGHRGRQDRLRERSGRCHAGRPQEDARTGFPCCREQR